MPIRSSVTVSLVPEARGGPFVFWDDLPAACRKAKALGFDAIEVFPPSADAPELEGLGTLLSDHGLTLAAMGTGAGWIRERLHLTHSDVASRGRARDFILAIIDAAAPLGLRRSSARCRGVTATAWTPRPPPATSPTPSKNWAPTRPRTASP